MCWVKNKNILISHYSLFHLHKVSVVSMYLHPLSLSPLRCTSVRKSAFSNPSIEENHSILITCPYHFIFYPRAIAYSDLPSLLTHLIPPLHSRMPRGPGITTSMCHGCGGQNTSPLSPHVSSHRPTRRLRPPSALPHGGSSRRWVDICNALALLTFLCVIFFFFLVSCSYLFLSCTQSTHFPSVPSFS